MQIQNLLQTQSQQAERPMREGEVYRATIKERTGENEAILSIRGREVRATFDGRVPEGERTTIEVTSTKGDSIQVRAISEESSAAKTRHETQRDMSQTLRQLGVTQSSTELRQAVQTLMDKGLPLTKESVQDLQRFLGEGKLEQRLQTVQALANKRLDVTSSHLHSVHEALHGRPLNRVLEDLARELNQASKSELSQIGQSNRFERSGQTSNEVRVPEANIQRAVEHVRQQVVNNPQVNRDAGQFVDRALNEASHLEQVGRDRIQQAIEHLARQATSPAEQETSEDLRAVLKTESLSQIVKEGRTVLQQSSIDDSAKRAFEKVFSQAQQLEQVGRERVNQALQKVENQVTENAIQGPPEGNKSGSSTLAEVIKHAQSQLQREASFERAIQQLQSQLLNHPAVTGEIQSELLQSLEQATERMNQGRELAGREQIMNTLQKIEQSINATELIRVSSDASAYVQNEEFQTSIELASKNIAVTTITEKLAKAAADFKSLQRDISRTLDQVVRQVDQFRSQAQVQAKPLLETTIKKLDNAILRSEMMLLTDMKTERSLMQASSQLAEAKKLLAKGQHQAANQIVKDVKGLVERLNFQPSETKVKHYVAMNEQQPAKTYSQQYTETVKVNTQDGGPRAMFETLRGIGLNRDSELAQQLALGRDQQQQENSQRNLKSALMQIVREEEGARASHLAQQALNNITGQQLLSRSDQQANLQSMFFNLPFLLQEKVENLQVYVNSRNEGQKVDWENCSLYFLMETQKMGEIGIMVNATERQLSVTLKNDQLDFQMRMEPLVQKAVERLSEIGYSINGIKYATLSMEDKQTTSTSTTEKQQPIFSEKGFDFKV
ncbi:hypothetical protein [Halalkalibacter urbisdiaboli]|uniref:hypothetical protein n=1 Tax=Halalkalibacter urbisdiaboli TaxID=1960589 RepID=UPI000B43CEF0|nr:hypothetical protein [Halalkalibacter urbisdiaboli]